ncbi:hypothetical protein PV08_11744 [Exophiala spinifera]|uniref:G domain-containing protein n=1 Tax=Exophiala spinifera TaxID=91928 RepID=A0A0D2ATD5_9EURO|nr:uncharacterized protein PV08_11744 [Exophiala spinifera]KIW09968.1 hypothetical protein PV08_11744 [Exophiala spinifera]
MAFQNFYFTFIHTTNVGRFVYWARNHPSTQTFWSMQSVPLMRATCRLGRPLLWRRIARPSRKNLRSTCVPTGLRTLVTESGDSANASFVGTVPETLQTASQNTPASRSSLQKNAILTSRRLPVSCPGCGALTQDVEPREAGYYSRSRKAVRTYLRESERRGQSKDGEKGAEADATDDESGEDVNQGHADETREIQHPLLPPMCDRCHTLIHESRGQPIAHPSIENIADSIAESPFSKNHVYHVMDVADFPMSCVPSIYKQLSLAKPRSQNRRSQHSFSSKPSLSFIITRSDLLGPSKEMVDRLMPKFIAILRTALSRTGQNLRLGNVHLVSAKRGWWTKDIKESIWQRGGGNWLVGKFNVGKSNLFEVLFPKGSSGHDSVHDELRRRREAKADDFLSVDGLLPPPQPEVPFPAMPVVSSLPGTTASPIRLPFGDNKGELIDLPGLERSGLDKYVKDEDKLDLVMTHRPTVTQHNIKPGQSLLLGGGLVRITPLLDENDPSTIMMAYAFVPLKSHVTATEKALSTQQQERESGIESILAEDAGPHMASAGRFELKTNVTKSRAGAVIRAGVDPAKLPFQVYATDILVEGVGWVELVCQVRKKPRAPPPTGLPDETTGEAMNERDVPTSDDLSIGSTGFVPFSASISKGGASDRPGYPRVEIFTPEGRFIGQRECLDVWQMWNTGKPRKDTRAARPRKPMSGAKKRAKTARRSAA